MIDPAVAQSTHKGRMHIIDPFSHRRMATLCRQRGRNTMDEASNVVEDVDLARGVVVVEATESVTSIATPVSHHTLRLFSMTVVHTARGYFLST